MLERLELQGTIQLAKSTQSSLAEGLHKLEGHPQAWQALKAMKAAISVDRAPQLLAPLLNVNFVWLPSRALLGPLALACSAGTLQNSLRFSGVVDGQQDGALDEWVLVTAEQRSWLHHSVTTEWTGAKL